MITVNLPPLKLPSDTQKLKKHIAMMCDRLSKGGKLAFENSNATINGLPDVLASDPSEKLTDDYPSKPIIQNGISDKHNTSYDIASLSLSI